jgi:hypothetical protein
MPATDQLFGQAPSGPANFLVAAVEPPPEGRQSRFGARLKAISEAISEAPSEAPSEAELKGLPTRATARHDHSQPPDTLPFPAPDFRCT